MPDAELIDPSTESNVTVSVYLRAVTHDDLPVFFEHQRDPEATQMAAFPSRERPDFMAHWEKILRDPDGIVKTIVVDGQTAGNLVCWESCGLHEVGYWLGREYWGRGIATRALREFLSQVETRPLFAHVARHNLASLRVLQKCGFRVTGEDIFVGDAPDGMVEELFLTLEANDEAVLE